MGTDTELELQRAVGRVEGKLDSFLAELERLDRDSTGLSKRVGKLEKWQTRLIGIGLGAGFVITFVFKYFIS